MRKNTSFRMTAMKRFPHCAHGPCLVKLCAAWARHKQSIFHLFNIVRVEWKSGKLLLAYILKGQCQEIFYPCFFPDFLPSTVYRPNIHMLNYIGIWFPFPRDIRMCKNSAVSLTAPSQTPWCHWQHRVRLRGVIDSTKSQTPWCHWQHRESDSVVSPESSFTVSLLPRGK